jgi:hypothetical protein
MNPLLNGETRLFPIIGDPVKYAESPVRLSKTFAERGYNGICIPMEVTSAGSRYSHGGPYRHIKRERHPRHYAAQIHCVRTLRH